MTPDQDLGVIHTAVTVDPGHDLVQEGTEGIHIHDHTHDLGLEPVVDHLPYLEDRDHLLFSISAV